MTAPEAAPPGGATYVEDRIARAVRRLALRAGRALVSYVPTRRLALVVALLAPAWLAVRGPRSELAIALGLAILAAVALLDAVDAPTADLLTVAREVPETLGLGDETPARYVIRSHARRTVRLRLHHALPGAIDSDLAAGAPRVVPPNGTATVDFHVTGRERGRWPLGPVVIRAPGRLGLVRHTLRLEPNDTVLVAPSMSGVRRLRLLALHHRLLDAGVRSIRRRGEGTTFSHLREYVVGDEPRRVDWKATARQNRLIVREYTVEQGQTVMLALDAGRMMTQLEDGVPRFEYALSSALLLADVAAQARDRIGALAFDDAVRAYVPAQHGRQALERVRRAVLPLRATMAEPDYAAAFRELGQRQRKRALVVLFTDVIDPRASRALIAHTSRSAGRHLLLVVALRNDALVRAAVPAATTSTATLYECAAAEELMTEREMALAQMRRAGVAVLDVSPHEMTVSVINRYLEIKARASL